MAMTFGARKRHLYDQARTQSAMVREWEARIERLENDRDQWKKRAESLLKPVVDRSDVLDDDSALLLNGGPG